MPLIALDHVSKRYGPDVILDNVSLRIDRGGKIGLVGVNGAGKTTLLRIIAGLEEPDAGRVSLARGTRIAYLPQDARLDPDDTVYDVMLGVFAASLEAQARLREIEQEMEGEPSDALMDEYGRLQAIVEHAGYDYREQIARVLTGLGLSESLWHAPVDTLSGGQRTRLTLARTLLREGDVLLLDEPTNHLDIPAVEWLEGYLRDIQRAVLIVAHDRYLLDRTTHRTLELSFHHVTAYDAPYEQYLRLRAERRERERKEYEAQQQSIAQTEEFIRRYGAGQRSKEARGRQKRLNRLERLDRPEEEAQVRLRAGDVRRTGDIVLTLDHLSVGYEGQALVRLPPEVIVQRGERVAVIGANGSGKTTLLRTILGALPPVTGEVRWGANTSIGYYSQTLEGLRDTVTVIEEIRSVRPMSEEEARTYLATFLFQEDDVGKSVSMLSGGERSRVALAKLILTEPNVLVLDEPTNHLDIASRDALQALLAEFPGTMLFVSHDRHLIDALAQELWVVADGTVQRYAGTYTAFAAGTAQRLDRPEGRGPDRAISLEERVRQLEEEAGILSGRLATISTTAPMTQLVDLVDRYAGVQASLMEAYEQWMRQTRKVHSASSD